MIEGEEGRGSGTADRDRQRRVEAKLGCIADPLRRNIYWSLRASPASAAEVAADLGITTKKVRHHIQSMREAGIVEAVGKTRRRGVSERLFFVCDCEMMISAAELSSVKSSLVERSHLATITRMWKEVGISSSRALHEPVDRFGHRTKADLLFDEQGWSEAHELLTDAAAEIKALRDRLPKRDARLSHQPMLYLVLFETSFRNPLVGSNSHSSPSTDVVRENPCPASPQLPSSRQLEILKVLAFRPASMVELADRLELPVHRVRADIRTMRAQGLVVIFRKRPRRNTVEYVYTVDSHRYQRIMDEVQKVSPRQRTRTTTLSPDRPAEIS